MRFSQPVLAALSGAERAARLQELQETLAARLRGAPDFHDEVGRIVMELRAQGHDLWSFDESDDFQVWCPDYTKPAMSGLSVYFHMPDEVEASWLDGDA